MHRLGSSLLLPVLVALAASTPALGQDEPAPVTVAPDEALTSSALPAILDAIQDLESARDAKCQATATRLENFMYGTPLTEEGRFEKVRLQKELVAGLWSAASATAREEGRERVRAEDLEPLAAAALPYDVDGEGDVHLRTRPGEELTLDATDLRHYSSVAYALRAILAVQQDALLAGGRRLAPAEDEALDVLRRLLDIHTLAALQLADREARRQGQPFVGPELFRQAWEGLARPVAAEVPREADAGPGPVTGVAQPVLRGIIDEKLSAYEAYNEIRRQEAAALFHRNIQRFYARANLPPGKEENTRLLEAFSSVMVDFAARLLRQAEALARERGEAVVRAPAMSRAVQELAPHVVDDLEDVTFFPGLPRERRYPLESYDMDSFRDFGMHWLLLRRALLREQDSLGLDLDPFAAEQVAEGIAQLGVLVFRIAGDIHRDEGRLPFLTAEDVVRAGRAVEVLAERSAAAGPLPPPDTSIASAGPGAGGGAARLTDATGEAGLVFRHGSSDWLSRLRRTLRVTPPTFSGGGIAAGDLNDDLHPDLLLVGGLGNRLFLNDGRGRFQEATTGTGIDYRRPGGHAGEARQPILADFDNDGLEDVLITYVDDPHRILRQLPDGRFEDRTATAGLGGEGLVGGPATVFDYDRDGLLDVYIGYFGNYLQGEVPGSTGGSDTLGTPAAAEYTGDLPTLGRSSDNALPNRLFRNLGDFRFADVTGEAGVGNTGWTQAVSHSDLDRNGWQDIIVANDFGRNAIYLNQGGGRFREATTELGMTPAYHSMNVGLADLNRDGFPEIYISNINTLIKDTKYVLPSAETTMESSLDALATMRIHERSILYSSVAGEDGLEEYVPSEAVERGETPVGWAWDADFFDFENDGDDDLYVLNGANEYRLLDELWMVPEGDEIRILRLSHHRQANVMFLNQDGKLRERSRETGGDVQGNARAGVYLDAEGDGDLDVAINNFHGEAQFLRNHAQENGNHWIKLRLVGDPARGSNRDAIGARILATTPGGKSVWREVHGGSGYLSMEPKVQHLGLGDETRADVVITWPGGQEQRIPALEADRTYRIEEGSDPVAVIPTPPRPTGAP